MNDPLSLWYPIVVVLTLVCVGILAYSQYVRTDSSLTRPIVRRVLLVITIIGVFVVSVPFLLDLAWWILTTTTGGVDTAYVVFGSTTLVAIALFVSKYTQHAPTWIGSYWKPIVAVAVLSAVLLVVYAYIATSGWLVMFTLFADDHRADHFQQMDQVFPATDIDRGPAVWELDRAEHSLPETYQFDGETRSTDEFLERTETTGLLVIEGETIRHESYYQGYDEYSRATSWSVGKSVTSALVGIAIDEGHIDDIGDPITKYVPELEGSGYTNVTIRDALTMSSGVAFDEEFESATPDPVMLKANAYGFNESMKTQLAAIEGDRQPGTEMEYVSVDTQALGLVIEGATGQPLTTYAEDRLWSRTGMEGDAFWNVDNSGTALAYCCLNAQLRDYGRFGMLYLNDGAWNDEQIVPAEWVRESTVSQPPYEEAPDAAQGFGDYDYGYQWWVPGDSTTEFEAHGVYGQYIHVNTEHDVVIVKTSTNPHYDVDYVETNAFFRSVVESLQ